MKRLSETKCSREPLFEQSPRVAAQQEAKGIGAPCFQYTGWNHTFACSTIGPAELNLRRFVDVTLSGVEGEEEHAAEILSALCEGSRRRRLRHPRPGHNQDLSREDCSAARLCRRSTLPRRVIAESGGMEYSAPIRHNRSARSRRVESERRHPARRRVSALNRFGMIGKSPRTTLPALVCPKQHHPVGT